MRSRQGFKQLPSTCTGVEDKPGVYDWPICLVQIHNLGWAKEPVQDHMWCNAQAQGQVERPLCCQVMLGRGIVVQALSQAQQPTRQRQQCGISLE